MTMLRWWEQASPMTDKQAELIAEAIRSLGTGDVDAPRGLEGIGIALAGNLLQNPIGDALEHIATALDRIADNMGAS